MSQAQHEHLGAGVTPNLDPCIMARKPLAGTVAANVLAHGTGALNIDGCRVEAPDGVPLFGNGRREAVSAYANGLGCDGRTGETSIAGRWPANLIHDGSDEVVALFPDSNGSGAARTLKRGARDGGGWGMADDPGALRDAGTGSAARFFYCAKASKRDRNEGLDDMPDTILARSCQAQAEAERGNVVEEAGGAFNKARITKNNHPTVKPTALMRYLCRLVTPPGGVVLDPYTGSGSTAKAAALEGFRFTGFEIDPDYHAIAERRWLAAIGELA